jgi:hypothetical protein
MGDTRPGTHILNFSTTNDLLVSHGVSMDEFALNHIRDNFHISVWVGWKSTTSCNIVLVNHAQVSESHVLGIVIASKRKGVMAFEPTMVSLSTFF